MSIANFELPTPKKGPAKRSVEKPTLSVYEHNDGFLDPEIQPLNAAKKNNQLILKKVAGVKSGNRSTILKRIRNGFTADSIAVLEDAFAVSRKDMAEVLSIPISTLNRRLKSGQLHSDESDRVARLARLKDATLELMQGDNEAAITWLQTPLDILDGESPMFHAGTEMGARDVEDLIGRLQHGVFS